MSGSNCLCRSSSANMSRDISLSLLQLRFLQPSNITYCSCTVVNWGWRWGVGWGCLYLSIMLVWHIRITSASKLNNMCRTALSAVCLNLCRLWITVPHWRIVFKRVPRDSLVRIYTVVFIICKLLNSTINTLSIICFPLSLTSKIPFYSVFSNELLHVPFHTAAVLLSILF